MEIRQPCEVGLPPLYKWKEGFQVLMTGIHCWMGDGKEWITINSQCGFPYETAGWAIRKAREWNRNGQNQDVKTCVVEIKSGNLVWTSWDNG